jgi:hypothetical protein
LNSFLYLFPISLHLSFSFILLFGVRFYYTTSRWTLLSDMK